MKTNIIFLLGIAFFLCVLSPAYSSGGAADNLKMLEAVRNNSLDEVKILAADGVNINASDDSGLSCLMIAVSKNHIDIINYLVSKGVELTAKDKLGWNAMLYAVTNDQPDSAAFLIEKGVSVESPDNEGTTALMYAVMNNSESMMNLLIKNGAELNSHNKKNVTPLICAVESGNSKIVEALINAGASANDSFMRAIMAGNTAAVKTMVENRLVNVNTVRDAENLPPVICAAMSANLEMLKLLCEAGANLSVKDNNNRGALFYAAGSGDVDVLKYLLNEGVLKHAVNGPDSSGRTPLFSAAENGNGEAVRFLLANGANPNAADNNGHKAIDWARANKMDNAVSVLERVTAPGANGTSVKSPGGEQKKDGSAFANPGGSKLFDSNAGKKDDSFNEFLRRQEEEKKKNQSKPADRPATKGSTTFTPVKK
jgi:ankyrin repeat protein